MSKHYFGNTTRCIYYYLCKKYLVGWITPITVLNRKKDKVICVFLDLEMGQQNNAHNTFYLTSVVKIVSATARQLVGTIFQFSRAKHYRCRQYQII